MKIAEFTVVEATKINEALNRICLEGGFDDAKTRVVFTTRENLKVGQILTVDTANVAAQYKAPEPKPFKPESKPAEVAESAPVQEKKSKKSS